MKINVKEMEAWLDVNPPAVFKTLSHSASHVVNAEKMKLMKIVERSRVEATSSWANWRKDLAEVMLESLQNNESLLLEDLQSIEASLKRATALIGTFKQGLVCLSLSWAITFTT